MVYTDSFHIPVLLTQIIKYLNIEEGKKYIDATLGGGGYTFEIVKRGGVVLAIDVDQEAIEHVKEKLKVKSEKSTVGKDIFLAQGNFANLKKIARRYDFDRVEGIIFDLGLSSYQLLKSGRGFSYQRDEPLDMRIGKTEGKTAADILNSYSEQDLYELFAKYSEEINSRAIAQAISRTRSLKKPIKRTRQLVAIIDDVLGKSRDRIKVLSRVFQALRIEVNNELTNLRKAIYQTVSLLSISGRLCIISYHSLEDRIVKSKFSQFKEEKRIKILTKKPIRPEFIERKANPRSRSAKLRVAEKIP